MNYSSHLASMYIMMKHVSLKNYWMQDNKVSTPPGIWRWGHDGVIQVLGIKGNLWCGQVTRLVICLWTPWLPVSGLHMSCRVWVLLLDSGPAESQGVAHLLPGNTLLSAPWHRTSIPVLRIHLSGVSMSHWLVLSCNVETKCEENKQKKKPKHFSRFCI